MIQFLSYLCNGISLGSVYAIIALGYTMVYGIAKMLNFAHGDVIMIGAYIAFCSMQYWGLPPVVSVPVAMIVCTVLGVVIERMAYKPLRQASSLAVLITAIGVSYLLQNVALLTDMDNENPEERNKVTLMTVHSAKGLEYKYVYIVGLEENLFPSQRAAESPDGMEEERRLFYVALTRAKVEATISYAEMRFKWGNMEFSRPSCFLREIDPKYVRADFGTGTGTDDDRPHRSPDGSAPSAIDELRRRFDYRFQQKQQAAGGNNPGSGGGRPGSNPGRGNFGGRPSDGESGPARRFARAAAPRDARPQGRPDPALVQAPRPSTDGMRRIGVRQAADGGVPLGDTMPVSGDYTVGQRVEHPKFGVGIVQRIETLATDHKLVVAFDGAGEKTLLAKFAKLTKL